MHDTCKELIKRQDKVFQERHLFRSVTVQTDDLPVQRQAIGIFEIVVIVVIEEYTHGDNKPRLASNR